jgi:hypothetical protein
MTNLRVWIIVSWIALPTVMFGGASLLRLINRGNVLSPFQVNCFRAGHAHAGVLLVMSLLYYIFLDQTGLSVLVKHLASAALFVSILAQSGGFFCAHAGRTGEPTLRRHDNDVRGRGAAGLERHRARVRSADLKNRI